MGQRPAHVKPPAYLSKSPPVPAPSSVEEAEEAQARLQDSDHPTRYGDWVLKGIAIDF